jgi:hypothetical protein
MLRAKPTLCSAPNQKTIALDTTVVHEAAIVAKKPPTDSGVRFDLLASTANDIGLGADHLAANVGNGCTNSVPRCLRHARRHVRPLVHGNQYVPTCNAIGRSTKDFRGVDFLLACPRFRQLNKSCTVKRRAGVSKGKRLEGFGPAPEPWEVVMRGLVTITALVALLSAGSSLCDRAEAGSSASAPSKYRNAPRTAAVFPLHTGRHADRGTPGITEFSSSSAVNHPQKR